MIINTGCRTDIPAFYSKRFMNRIRVGYVLVRNPYYPSQITKYLLNPEVVDCIEFCTKKGKIPNVKKHCLQQRTVLYIIIVKKGVAKKC